MKNQADYAAEMCEKNVLTYLHTSLMAYLFRATTTNHVCRSKTTSNEHVLKFCRCTCVRDPKVTQNRVCVP